jgi:predicted enzyme related to lactoylglutathione lyase
MTPIVYFDLAGPDAKALAAFYSEVFGWQTNNFGQLTVEAKTPLMGGFRDDPAETMIYLGVPDVTAALEKVVAHGGRVHAPRYEVPGVVVLGLFYDVAGNRVGLVEMDGDTARIP